MISQNYPNPLNPTTKISYSIPQKSFVKLAIINILGQTIETIVTEEKDAGHYDVDWWVKVPSGVYFYRMEAIPLDNSSKRFVDGKTMIVLK